jgi:hypothetical protein
MKKIIFVLVLMIIFCLISCEFDEHLNSEVIYIYEGKYSASVLYRVENNKVYEGRYGLIVLYRIDGDRIYDNDYNLIYSIWNDRIYEGVYDKVKFVIRDNFIYNEYGIFVKYRIEKN